MRQTELNLSYKDTSKPRPITDSSSARLDRSLIIGPTTLIGTRQNDYERHLEW